MKALVCLTEFNPLRSVTCRGAHLALLNGEEPHTPAPRESTQNILHQKDVQLKH